MAFNYTQQFHIPVYKALLKYPDILKFIREKRYRVADTGLTYRQLNSLDSSELIHGKRNSDKDWREFSITDLLYLHLVSKSREFKTRNSQLKKLKSEFYGEFMNYKDVGIVLYSELAVLALLIGNIPLSVQIRSDGEIIFSDTSVLTLISNNKASLHIFLPETFEVFIEKITSDQSFTKKFDLKEFIDDYSPTPVSRKERALLNLIANNSFSQITIEKKVDGSLLVRGLESLDGNAITEKEFRELCESVEFGDFETIKRDGKIVAYKFTKVYKIKD